MKSIHTFITIVLAASISAISCQKPPVQEEQPPVVTPEPEKGPVATYTYDGKEYPVNTIAYAANASSTMVRISPLEKKDKLTTYAVIGINSSLDGTEIDVGRAWNNDDYYFIYEDPLKYYSQYRKLESGTIMIRKTGNDFHVKADIILPDGTVFKFEYDGPIDLVE